MPTVPPLLILSLDWLIWLDNSTTVSSRMYERWSFQVAQQFQTKIYSDFHYSVLKLKLVMPQSFPFFGSWVQSHGWESYLLSHTQLLLWDRMKDAHFSNWRLCENLVSRWCLCSNHYFKDRRPSQLHSNHHISLTLLYCFNL